MKLCTNQMCCQNKYIATNKFDLLIWWCCRHLCFDSLLPRRWQLTLTQSCRWILCETLWNISQCATCLSHFSMYANLLNLSTRSRSTPSSFLFFCDAQRFALFNICVMIVLHSCHNIIIKFAYTFSLKLCMSFSNHAIMWAVQQFLTGQKTQILTYLLRLRLFPCCRPPWWIPGNSW